MHLSTAKEFLSLALQGFFTRNFSTIESEDTELMECRIDRCVEFVDDPCPYWVKEKSLQLLTQLDQLESELRNRLVSVSSSEAIDLLISRTTACVSQHVKLQELNSATGRIVVFRDRPKLSNQTPPSAHYR